MSAFDETVAEETEGLWGQEQEKEVDGGYIDLPDGSHQVRTITTRIEQASWDEEEWQLFIQYAEVNGKGTVPQWYTLNPSNEVGFGVTAKVCKQLGYVGTLRGLRQYVEDGGLVDMVCDVNVKTKPGETRDFRTVYINAVHGKAADRPASTDQFVPQADVDDDIPF